jgi:hypothetical protein
MFRAGLLCFILLGLGAVRSAAAQGPSLELTFTPIDRAQIAVWVERDDGTYMGTLALTYAVAKAGIGNRPGASQMNSGYRWPYGRREGVLPVWAHRRAGAAGAQCWKRVIFQNRSSEGFASRTASDQSADNYYCLSFKRETTGRDALDAVTCASVFSSDKGRYLTDQDLAKGYAEPFETAPGEGGMRQLDDCSLYPPRRDVERCTLGSCFDHADVDDYRRHALQVMPELDAVTRATLQGRRQALWTFDLPADWSPSAHYKLFMEVNVEGDYNASYDATTLPTPSTPATGWDLWARQYGYAFRGQPSVVYAIDFSLDQDQPATATTLEPIGYGALAGENGELKPLDESISDDDAAQSGSGADRLLAQNGVRASLRVLAPDSPYCQRTQPAGAVGELKAEPYPSKSRAHMWARLSFDAAPSERQISSYVVEVKAEGSDWEQAYTPDAEQELLPVAMDVCADPDHPAQNRCAEMAAGTPLSVTLAGLRQSTHYQVRVTPRDHDCGELGQSLTTDFTTRARAFSTVTPCFVATAAYGTPLAGQIAVLRAARDRYLIPHAWGRALVDFYYRVGPSLAQPVRAHPWLASAVRAILAPIVSLTAWWME